ncbi:MAG: signal peptidase I [Clostridia bacterium]|nr:signal peptidase I [Clostridia bacterium]
MDNTPAAPERPAKKKQTPISAAYDYLEIFVYSAVAVILLFTFFTRLTSVVGPSMQDTLYEGQKLLVSDIGYDPTPGDIIVYHELGDYNEPIVKRVIATEGQVVDIDFTTWTLTVDGEVVDEPYRKVDSSFLLTSDQSYPVTVPENCLFVMGDNRNHSSDSRSTRMGQNGFIDERQVLGRVVLRLTPFDLFGAVE